jgi:hypothetical protein
MCPRPITAADVARWDATRVLLPIVTALRDSGADLRRLPMLLDRGAEVERAAAAACSAERAAIPKIIGGLEQAGIAALLLKGAALSYTVYRSPWLRPHSDIDLLIPPGTLDRAQQVFEAMGFVAAREVSHPLISRQRHFHRSRGVRVAVDVHDALVNPAVLQSLPSFVELASRAVTIPVLQARGLCTRDALLHALVHRVAHHNGSSQVLWFYDLHLLAHQMTDTDWRALVETCRRSRVSRIASDGLIALGALFDSQVPESALRELAAVEGEPSAALVGGHLTEWRLQWINFKSLPGVSARIEFVRAHLLPPANETPLSAVPAWRLPWGYAARAFHGARKWMRPIASG